MNNISIIEIWFHIIPITIIRIIIKMINNKVKLRYMELLRHLYFQDIRYFWFLISVQKKHKQKGHYNDYNESVDFLIYDITHSGWYKIFSHLHIFVSQLFLHK